MVSALLGAAGCYTHSSNIGPFTRQLSVAGDRLIVERCTIHYGEFISLAPGAGGRHGKLSEENCRTASQRLPGATAAGHVLPEPESAAAAPKPTSRPAPAPVDLDQRRKCGKVLAQWQAASDQDRFAIEIWMPADCYQVLQGRKAQ